MDLKGLKMILFEEFCGSAFQVNWLASFPPWSRQMESVFWSTVIGLLKFDVNIFFLKDMLEVNIYMYCLKG